MNRRLRSLALAGIVLGALLAAGCRSGPRADPILQMSAAEALAEGQRLFAAKKYGQAHPFFMHAFEVEPNSPSGREALLLAADSLFMAGGDANFLQAEARYRDFQNRFPTSDRAPYVQLQIGRSLAERMERPDRDQKVTRQAREAFEDLLRLYPASVEADPALAELRKVKDRLAAHEAGVGEFYLRFGLPFASVARFEALLAAYPEYSATDEVLFHLAAAYDRMQKSEEAERTRRRLREEFPASPWTGRAAKAAG